MKIGIEKYEVLTATQLPAKIPAIDSGRVLNLAAEIQALTLFICNLIFVKIQLKYKIIPSITFQICGSKKLKYQKLFYF